MKPISHLAALPCGKRGSVVALNNEGSIRQRLMDLGLVEGTEVECVGESPRGGMRAYRFRGAVIALRRCDSKNVLLTMEEPLCASREE